MDKRCEVTIFQVEPISMLDSKGERIEGETEEVLSTALGQVIKWKLPLKKSSIASH